MTVTDLAQRAAPLMRNALDDEERGVHARRQPPPRTLLQRAGEALQASGQAIIALSHVEKPRPKRRGRKLLALVVAGAGAAGIAPVARLQSGGATDGRE
jgi:hypothetical protein